MIKAIISDLDETLLTLEKDVSEKNKAAIDKIRQQGLYFIPATGRPFYSMQKTLKDLNLFKEDDYAISYNGGMIHRNHDQKVIVHHDLDFDLISALFEIGQKEKLAMHVYSEHLTYAFNMNDEERHHIRNFPGVKESHETSLDFLKDEKLIKILYQDLDLDYLRSVEKTIPQDLKDQLEISYSSNRYLEFNPKGISKGMAILEVAKILGIKAEEILTIGDNLNDLSMLLASGYSGAPQNAVDTVKKHVDYVSPYPFTQDSVADIIKHFIQD